MMCNALNKQLRGLQCHADALADLWMAFTAGVTDREHARDLLRTYAGRSGPTVSQGPSRWALRRASRMPRHDSLR